MLFSIGLGGSLGAALRYGISLLFQKRERSFPLHTFVVNVIGSLLLGMLTYAFVADQISSFMWTFWGVGFCGAFTTFSTFSYEVVILFEKKRVHIALLYIISSIIVSFFFAAVGFYI